MDLYVTGVGIALLIGIVKLVSGLAARFSVKARNFAKLGLHYRAATGGFELEGTTPVGWAFLAIWLVLLAPLGSWLSVASAAWTFVSAMQKRRDVPAPVRAFAELISTRELSKEQLIEAQEEAQRQTGSPGAVLTGSEGGTDPSNLVLMNDSGWWSEVTANAATKTLVFYGHSDDYHSVFHSTEEYRFDGGQVLTRLLEDYVEHPGETRWHVKDGVVLESEMRGQAEKSWGFARSLDEELARYRAQVEWHPVENLKLRFFIMGQHPAEFPLRERRRLIRTELERLEAAARKLVEEAKAHGLEPQDDDQGTRLMYPQSFTEADKARVDSALNAERYAALGITASELAGIKGIRTELLKLLGEPA